MSQIASSLAVDNAVRSGTQPNRFSEMTTEDFIQIIFTELTNQDPLEPNDTGALLDQLNSIRSIESDIQLTRQLEALVTENQLASASGLIGKFIGGRTEDFQDVTGFVLSPLRRGDTIELELDSGWVVPIENVESIIDPSIFAQPAEPSAAPPAVPEEPGEGADEDPTEP
jgi:flagellar basal-body rod modification protein FlgD